MGLTEANTVGEDTAIVYQDLVDSALGAVLLEFKQYFPDLSIEKRSPTYIGLDSSSFPEELFKDMEKGLIVDKLRRMILVELLQILENLAFYVFYQFFIIP